MGHVHLLPGSTDASPSKRAGHHSENEAKLTLTEFTEWLALRKASSFGEPAMIQTLIKHASGVTGRVTWLLGRAAERAIEDGSERIVATDIERVSERLRIAAA
jgi:hypothetical protein